MSYWSLKNRSRQADRRARRVDRCRFVPGNVRSGRPEAEALEARIVQAGGVSAAFSVTSDWGTGYQAQVQLTNTQTSSVANWQLGFDLNASISSIWDASVVSHVGTHYVISGNAYDNAIPASGTLSFGFVASPGHVASPTNITINGVAAGGGTTTPPVPPTLSVADARVTAASSGTTTLPFVVSLSGASTSAITVSYATSDGTAHAGPDYQSAAGSVTFAPGVTAVTIPITIVGDSNNLPTETLTLQLAQATGASITRAQATGTVVETTVTPPIDHPPVAGADSATTTQGFSVTIPVLANDTDPDNDPLTVASFTQPKNGAVVAGTNGALIYTPTSTFMGTDTFTYVVSDGRGGTATGTVTVTVVAPAPTPTPTPTSAWPAHFYAPYVDMGLYPTYNLANAAKSGGVKDFTLAFVTADPSGVPSWGGYASYDINGSDFDMGVRAQVAAVRALGGDVMVSFGGASGQELAQAITDPTKLTAAYQQVVTAYNLTHLDFDIEGAASADHASIDRRSTALAALQSQAKAAGKPLQIWLTLPVLPTGLTADGLYAVQSALKAGVQLAGVNGMAMDYGETSAPSPSGQMGTYAIGVAQSLHDQLKTAYNGTLTDSQLWSMVGVTPMIGLNDDTNEVFDQAAASQLTTFATQKGVGRISIWSLNRDQQNAAGAIKYVDLNSSSLVQNPYAFSKIFEGFQA